MKKILFAAIAVCGFVVVNAQATAVPVTAPINVKIEKTIEIVPLYGTHTVTFNQPAQFGTWQSMGETQWGFNSTDPFSYTVSFDRGTIPGGVQVRYDIQDFGSYPDPATDKDIATPTTVHINGGVNADDFMSIVTLEANVVWGIPSGDYSGTMTITASCD